MSWHARRIALFVAAGLSFALGACSDVSSPMAPPPEASQSNSGGDGPSGSGKSYSMTALTRKAPLASDEVATAKVGLLGATLTLPKSGLTMVVPPLAAPLGTQITVRAPAGDLVGYEFSPHGLQFKLPVILTQDLTKTNSTGLLKPLVGGYYTGTLSPVVKCLELLQVKLLNLVAIMSVNHFSGYVIATDFSSESDIE